MSTLLLGSETLYPDEQSIDASADEGFKFTAVASGTLDTLEIYVTATSPTAHSVYLSIYTDSGDAPNTRLAYGSVDAAAGAPGWVSVTGLSVAITAGTSYWLAATPLDGHFSALKAFAGGRDVVTNNGSPYVTAPGNPWRGIADTNFSYDHGPVAFRGMAGGPGGPGVTPLPPIERATTVEVGITTLHYPEKTTSPTHPVIPARVLDWAMDFENLLVTIPRNERRTAEVSFSFDDAICQHLYRVTTETATNHEVQITTAYEVMLFVRYRGYPVIWAPIVHMDWRGAERRVTVSATDVQRLIDHQIHLGDDALDPTGVTLGGFGFDEVIGAADLTGLQETDGTPAHGIQPPGSSGSSTLRVLSTLDDGVWDKLVEMSTYEGAPDFSVVPYDIEDYPGAWYAKFTTYPDGQGDPNGSDRLKLEAGFGVDNAESMDWSPGGTYMTHAVVRNASNTSRVIQANVDARRRTGPYVHVENIKSDSADGTMTARAEMLIKAYSQPVDAHSVVLRNDLPNLVEGNTKHPASLHYLDDFDLGDTITVEAHDAYFNKRVVGQINQVRLRQDGHEVKQEIDVVPELVGVLDLSDEEV